MSAEETSRYDGDRFPRAYRRTPRKESRLRAILKAPPIVATFYRAGLIGQDIAAKVGSPSCESQRMIAAGLERLASAEPCTTLLHAKHWEFRQERKQFQRIVNSEVRRTLGLEEDRVAVLACRILQLTAEERDKLRWILEEYDARRVGPDYRHDGENPDGSNERRNRHDGENGGVL